MEHLRSLIHKETDKQTERQIDMIKKNMKKKQKKIHSILFYENIRLNKNELIQN